jgi:hypothetical protein
MDTLPSEVQQTVALGRPWPYPAFAFMPVLDVSIPSAFSGQRGYEPASWIWRSFERQRDFSPPEQRTAQRPLPACPLLAANILNHFSKRGFSEKCYSFPAEFLFHEEGPPLPANIF